jgi:alpha-amylase/alpha-mannosidase (GH57 family)
MSFERRWSGGNGSHPVVRTVMVVAILAVLLLSSLAVATFFPVSPRTGGRSSALSPAATYETVTFTGNPTADFPSDALLYTNWFTPWGAGNNLSGLYGTWDATNLYLGLTGVKLSGNQLLFAVSNGTSWGTTNLSNLHGVSSVAQWDRTIDFTQPMSFLFIANKTGTLFSYAVTSQPGLAQTNVTAIAPTNDSSIVTVAGGVAGSLEIELPFTSVFKTFPDFANVSLYAGVFGGSAGYVGPTIPSGQSYDVNYEGAIQLTSHDRPGGYLLENTFYKLGLDPAGLGHADSGLTPNYVENETFHTVAFTGHLATDFAPGELALINTNTMYGSGNLLNSSYITWNETTLFLGFNASIGSNYLYFFVSNDTGSGLGMYGLNVTNFAHLNRPFVFSQAVNFVGLVNYSSTGSPGPTYLYSVSTPASSSNTSVTLLNVTTGITTGMNTRSAIEVAIPFSLLYGRPGSWPVLGQFANISLIAAVVGGGGPSTGPTLPAGQGYAYTGYYNKNHTAGYDELLNTFFTENLDPYGDAVPALQINPTYTYGHTYHSVEFTGIPTNDFVTPEIVGTNTSTPWGPNWVNITYASWNYTDLFIGTESYVSSGNWFLVAISNNTGVGATNFSSTNVANLTRNFLFGTPINFVFVYSGGAPNGSLFEVNLAGTTSTHTQFTFLKSILAGKGGDEFVIPFSTFYPNQPAVAGADAIPPGATPQLVAFIYGGPGAYIGPTIPNGQSFSSATQSAPINAFVPLRLDPNKNGYSEPGIVPGAPAVVYSGAPISLNIVFNDHQPLYEPIGGSLLLPWTVVHLEEYAEQALLAGLNPKVNITYSLSGSLLYQIAAVALGGYNNSYLEAAMIPSSQWGNSVYTEVKTYGDTFLGSFVQPYQWNTTTVAHLLEYNLAFNTPPWAYTAPTAASATYLTLFHLYQSDTTLTTAQLTNALAEFFLWSTSYPIITGQLGSAYINSTMWALFNQSSFSISNINTIAGYYPVEAKLVLSAFSHDRMLNNGAGGNVEIVTTPFDHPIVPLLLLNNWTDENGAGIAKGVWSTDTVAQLQIGSQLYQQLFGQAPLGLWSPEQAVSASMVSAVNNSGYEWTSSSEATLAAAGISVPGSGAVTAQEMENLYAPYKVTNGTAHTDMVFRDDTLSNDWGFNYGTVANISGNWVAVGQFMAYLKNIYATIPRGAHATTLVTMALDGENWMFMSPFPEDGVPFLQDVYTALEQNSSWLETTTTQQYLASGPTLATISSLPTGSWNSQPAGSGINSYLGQWAGHGLQDALWEQLALVRSEVQAYGTTNSLTQPETLAALEAANDFPHMSDWNTSTAQDKYTQAWIAIYGAEGSDTYFALDPSDQSPTAQNAIVFENIIRTDLALALTTLGLPLTPFLESPYVVPLTPTTWGTNASVTPLLDGSLYTTGSFPGGIGYSVNHNDAWSGAYVRATGDTTAGSGQIASTTYAFDVSNLYFSIAVNGATSAYKSPNFYTAATDAINIYFSPYNLAPGDVQALNVPNSVYAVGSVPFGFAATTEATIEGNSVTPTGSATLGIFASSPTESWTSTGTVAGDAFVGGLLQLQVPMTELGMVPGDSVEFFVAVVNGTTGAPVSWSGPMEISVPSALAKLTLISTIHNTAPDNGPGNYVYPTDLQGQPTTPFPPQSTDMQWVNVSMNPYTVQFNITFGNLSSAFGGEPSQPIIQIYIHEPGSAGSTTGMPGPAINLSAQSAWEWGIQAAGYAADDYIENSATHIENPAPVLVSTNLGEAPSNTTWLPHKTVSIEVPTSLIGSAISTYSYVIVAGSQDGYGTNGWRIVFPTAQQYQGGGSLAADSSNVYSYISPAMVGSNPVLTQQNLLSNYSATHYATLVGIYLPLLKTTTAAAATLGPSAIVNASGDPDAYYAVGSQVYSSSSTGGAIWTAPTPLVNLSFVPVGMAATGEGHLGLLAWNGSSYVFENLATHTFTNGTASGTIEAGALTYAAGAYVVALDVGGTVSLITPGVNVWGSDALGAVALGLATYSGGTYLAYANATAVNVIAVTLASGTATFGTKAVMTAALPQSATAESLSLVVAPNGAAAVAVAAKNASGSNIYLATGLGAQTLKAITTDGADSSPSVLLGNASGTYEAYVGFTSSAGSKNVFFLPTPVGTVTRTSVPPPSSSSSSGTPWWVWVVIAVVVVLVIIGLVVALARRRKGGAAPATPEGPTEAAPESEATAPQEPSDMGGSPPESGSGSM